MNYPENSAKIGPVRSEILLVSKRTVKKTMKESNVDRTEAAGRAKKHACAERTDRGNSVDFHRYCRRSRYLRRTANQDGYSDDDLQDMERNRMYTGSALQYTVGTQS